MLSSLEIDKLRTLILSQDEKLAGVFAALSDLTRFRIFRLLLTSQDDLCVTEIAQVFEISVPAASQQLKIMEQAGLITPERNGQMTCYRVERKNIMTRFVMKFL